MTTAIPVAILSDALQRAIRGRRVRVAVFTTFAFEPGFFEEEIVPVLFEQSFSHVPKIRLVQLEESLRAVDHMAVYYDRRALVTSGTSASLDIRRIPMSRATGYFHPKVIMLLVESAGEQASDALIVAVLSANLTRAGWWENVECACLYETEAGSRCSFRQDLLDFMRRIRGDEVTGELHEALEAIRSFVVYKLYDESFRSSQGVMHPRLFTGAQRVSEFLSQTLPKLHPETYNLEIVSPYFEETDSANTLREIIDALAPKETRIYLPQADDGKALCREAYYEAVAHMRGVRWGKLPRSVVQRGRGDDENQADRFVHSKAYRLWSRAEGREYVFIGSVNLTRAAHTRANAGNLEAAMLVDLGAGRTPSFWLDTVEDSPSRFRVEEQEEATGDLQPPPLSVRHLWDENRTEYYWQREAGLNPDHALFLWAGAYICRLEPIAFDQWTPLPAEVSQKIAALLRTTSFLEVRIEDGPVSTVLISEEGMAHKPPILLLLTAEEILRYWSLLSPEQREVFLTDKMYSQLVNEGLAPPRSDSSTTQSSLFDGFAGIFHAFSRLDEHVSKAIEAGHNTEAVYRLFGRKYDSLPSLIDRVLAEGESDLVNRYVTLLTARQLLIRLKRKYADFFQEHNREAKELQGMLDGVNHLREKFDFAELEERQRFFGWFERMFFQEVQPKQPS